MSSRSLPPPSLQGLLLAWLLPGVAALLVVSAVGSYFVASSNAKQAFDRSLLNLAVALANQAQVRGGELIFELQPQARQILLTDKLDVIRYAVFDSQGQLIAGRGDVLPKRGYGAEDLVDGRLFFDDVADGKPVRGVLVLVPIQGSEVMVAVTQTLVKREMQVGELLISTLLPEAILFVATIVLLLYGVEEGLRPLNDLRQQLARRAPSDLSHVEDGNVPAELRPLVDEINRLLDRHAMALGAQRHFVADAAHQLRTPLAATLAQLESARMESADGRLDPVLSSFRRLVRLVNQLLALARAEPGGMAMSSVSLQTMVEGEADGWLELALARDIDLGFELAPAVVMGIPLLLQELAGNLVDNAIRYTPRGGCVTVRTGVNAAGPWLSVDDNGPGVPPDQRSRIFERFFRGDSESGASGGSGLGLAIVRRIAMQHRASVEYRDGEDGGACFIVHFPFPEEPSAAPLAPSVS